MDDLGNVIYVLAAIGWFFWNAYRKSKEGNSGSKKGPKQNKPRPADSAKGDYAKSLEEMILEQFKDKDEELSKPATVETTQEPSSKYKNQEKFLNVDLDGSRLTENYRMSEGEMGSHRIKRQEHRQKVVEPIGEVDSIGKFLQNEPFDLRKAVVLNAILERPYK